jgi:hypothetical protein
MNLNIKALIGNILLIVMELAGLIVAIHYDKGLNVKYYTNWSNYLGLLSGVLFLINFSIKEKNKTFNIIVKILKITSVVCLTVTFLVVLFMFVPYYNFNFYRWMIYRNFFSFHFLSPVIAFITFIFFEKYEYKYILGFIEGFTFTIIYSVIVSILVLLKQTSAPYDFFDYYAHKWYLNVLTLTGMFACTTLLIFFMIFIKKKQLSSNSEIA